MLLCYVLISHNNLHRALTKHMTKWCGGMEEKVEKLTVKIQLNTIPQL